MTDQQPRCATCKWWDKDANIPDWGTCERLSGTGDDRASIDCMSTVDVGHALFDTAPDFGCVLHEPKDST